jgi:hypothetical protein
MLSVGRVDVSTFVGKSSWAEIREPPPDSR